MLEKEEDDRELHYVALWSAVVINGMLTFS